MNPFDYIDDNPFNALGEAVEEQPKVSDEYAERAARLHALGEMDPVNKSALENLEMMQQTVAKTRDLVRMTDDNTLRMSAALKQQTAQLEGLTMVAREAGESLEADPALIEGSTMAAAAVFEEDAARRAEYAMEQRAIERIRDLAASGDETQARLLLNNLQRGSTEEYMVELQTKQLILAREIEKLEADKGSVPWLYDAANFILSAFPLYSSTGSINNVDIDEGLKGWLDWMWSGERKVNEGDALMDMPLHEFSTYVRDQLVPHLKDKSTILGFHDKSKQLHLLQDMANMPSAYETNIWNTLDNGVIAGALAKGGYKAATGMTNMLIRNGARAEKAALVARGYQSMVEEGVEGLKSKALMSEDDLTDNLHTSATNPNPVLGVPTATDTAAILERAEKLVQEYLPRIKTDRFRDPAEAKAAFDAAVADLEQSIGREIKDVKPVERVMTTGSVVTDLEFVLGKKAGGGFSAEGMAKRYGDTLSLPYETFQDVSGQWFVKVTRTMPETGFFKPIEPRATNSISRLLMSGRNVSDEYLANLAQHAGNKRNAVMSRLAEQFEKKFRPLRGNERESLAQVLAKGETEARWFSPNELEVLYERAYGRLPSKVEREAYQAARDLNDIEYILRNDEVYTRKLVQGMEGVSFKVPGRNDVDMANAIVDRSLTRVESQWTFDLSDGTHWNAQRPLTPERLDDLRSRGYIAVKVETAVEVAEDVPVQWFIGRPDDFKIGQVSRVQLPYRAGGHRFNTNKYFLKQTVRGRRKDTGEEFLRTPRTVLTAGTKAELDFALRQMEEARRLYNELDDPQESIAEILGEERAKDFIMDMNSGKLSPDEPFVGLYDREMPEEYTRLSSKKRHVLDDEEDTGLNGFLGSPGGMYYGRKGEQLRDWMGELTPVLDPFEAIDQSLKNVANLSSFSDYKLSSVERWVETFGDYLNKAGYPVDASKFKIFTEAKLAEGTPDKIRQAALAQKAVIQRNLNWKTEADRSWEATQRRFSEWVVGSDPFSNRHKIGKAFTNWWDETNPIQALRGVAFDMKLGLFNIAQMPLQFGTYLATMSVSPKYGLKSFLDIVPMRTYMLSKNPDGVLDQLAKNGAHKMMGFEDVAEWKQYMKISRDAGFFDGVKAHQYVGSRGTNLKGGIKSFAEAGRFFFYEGETMARIPAWGMAWREMRDMFPDMAVDSPAFLRRVAGKAEDYSFQMSDTSKATWQHGITSIPTQFWAYNVRMLEALVGDSLTTEQKFRLVMGQTFFYGSAGFPVWAILSEHFKSKEGEAPKMDTWLGALDRGALDTFMYHIAGADVQLGDRFGSGSWLPQLYKDIMGTSQYGPKSVADILGGATFSIFGQTVGDAKALAEYAIAESGGDTGRPLTRRAFEKLAGNISTVGNALKAQMIFQYGVLKTSKGTTLLHDVPDVNGWAIMLSGAQPGALDDMGAKLAFNKEKGKAVEEASKVIENYRVTMLNTDDPYERMELAEEINLFVKLLPDDVRYDAIKKAHGRIDHSLYEGAAQRTLREKQKESYWEDQPWRN